MCTKSTTLHWGYGESSGKLSEVINTSYYILNRAFVRLILSKPHMCCGWEKVNIGYFKVFECKCLILNNKDQLEKFDEKENE